MRYQISSFQLLKQLLQNIPEGDACVEWPRNLNKRYGIISIDQVSYNSNRAAYIITHGPIPRELVVCHRCDNTRCIRPSHLFLGTQAENVQDSVRKGRAKRAYGSKHGRAKLSEDQVREIIAMHDSGIKQVRIAEKFSVCQQLVSQIVSRRIWKHQ